MNIKEEEKDRKQDIFKELCIKDIRPNPKQSRKEFDKESLRSLGRSIRKRGLLNPISVRRDKGNRNQFIIIHGERRWRACRLIGFEKIPAIIREGEYTEDDLAIDQLIENIVREDLKVMEKSEGIQYLLMTVPGIKKLPPEQRHNACLTLVAMTKNIFEDGAREMPKPSEKNYFLTESDMEKCSAYMKMIGMKFNTATAHLKVLELPEDIREKVVFSRSTGRVKGSRKSIPFRCAYEISRLNNASMIRYLAQRIMRDGWTSMRVRATVDTIIQEKMEEYGSKYRSMKPKIKDMGMEKLADECYGLATKITNWRRICLPRCRYTPVDFSVGLRLLRKASKELNEAVVKELEGEKGEEKLNAVERAKEFVTNFGGSDNRIAIPSKIIKSYGIPSFRSKYLRKEHKCKKWKLRIRIMEAWEAKEENGTRK